MRGITALALVAAFTTQATAEEVCTLEHAVYTDGELGYALKFRPAKSWELPGMTSVIYELTLPDGRQLWGGISSNMGTSREIGSLYSGCDRPGPDDGNLTEEQIDACRVWHNNVYALIDGRVAGVPFADEPAPPSLILADLGRALRYTVLTSPGEEPWDQFDLTGCD